LRLKFNVEDEKDRRGMAHGGSYTDIIIPTKILSALIFAQENAPKH